MRFRKSPRAPFSLPVLLELPSIAVLPLRPPSCPCPFESSPPLPPPPPLLTVVVPLSKKDEKGDRPLACDEAEDAALLFALRSWNESTRVERTAFNSTPRRRSTVAGTREASHLRSRVELSSLASADENDDDGDGDDDGEGRKDPNLAGHSIWSWRSIASMSCGSSAPQSLHRTLVSCLGDILAAARFAASRARGDSLPDGKKGIAAKVSWLFVASSSPNLTVGRRCRGMKASVVSCVEAADPPTTVRSPSST